MVYQTGLSRILPIQSWGGKQRCEYLLLTGIVFLALTLRIGVAAISRSWVISGDQHFWHFGYEMGEIGASVAMGAGFSRFDWITSTSTGPTASMPPVYPLLIALAFKVLGIFTAKAAIALQAFQTAASVLTCLLLYCVGKRLSGSSAGICAAFLYAVYPPAVYYSVGLIWASSLFTCLMVMVLLLLLNVSEDPSWRNAASLGAMLGFAALVDATILATCPFALAWLVWVWRGERRRLAAISTAMLAFLVVLSPWVLRNYSAFGTLTLVKSNFGEVLFLGNNEFASTSALRTEDLSINWEKAMARIALTQQSEVGQSEDPSKMDEAAWNSFALRQAVKFIRTHPLRFAELTLTRIFYYWLYIRPVGTFQEAIAYAAYILVLALATVGIALRGQTIRCTQVLLIILLTFPLPYYVTVVALYRYRFPIESILIVFAGFTLSRVWRRMS